MRLEKDSRLDAVNDTRDGGRVFDGEVLLEAVQLQTPADLPPGSYRLAVGWYDAATVQRLTAVDAAGLPAPDNLLVLPVDVQVD